MSVIAKVQIVSAKKIFQTGDNLKELSENEKKILVKQGFAYSDDESFIENDMFHVEEEMYEDIDEILSEEELRKKKKADIVEYAKKFGLELSEELAKEELIASVLNFIEEIAQE